MNENLQEIRDKLDKLGIDWAEHCPKTLKGNGCPSEIKADWIVDRCPRCWLKYGNIEANTSQP